MAHDEFTYSENLNSFWKALRLQLERMPPNRDGVTDVLEEYRHAIDQIEAEAEASEEYAELLARALAIRDT